MKRLQRRGFVLALLGLAFAAGAVWLVWESCGLRGCPNVGQLGEHLPAMASVVLDRRGTELVRPFAANREFVSLDSLPAYVPAAFVAIEDKRFWKHRGVDWHRVLGAAWTNLRALEVEEGSSTITMQLARNAFPQELPPQKRTVWRKLAEMRVAREIEARYTKRQILELYLNQIYFGERAWGIEAAAQEYFGKPAAELSLGEAALLAGVPRTPSRLNPRVNLAGALARRRVVLRRMVAEGWITPEEAAAADREPVRLKRGAARTGQLAPYFLDAVRRALEESFGGSVYSQGLRIHTTLDLRMQQVVEEEIARQLAAIEAGRYGAFRHPPYGAARSDTASAQGATSYLQVAAVVMDVRNGDVLALVGGRDYRDSEFNRATQARRQPGSAFKPIVYAAALADGYPPTFRLADRPLEVVLANGRVWSPKNYDGTYAGEVTLRDALVFSKNVATVRIAEEVGIDAVIRMAQRLGLSGNFSPVPALALGAAEVTLLELTAAYAAFATLGSRPEPRFITRIEDHRGNVIRTQPPSVQQVLEPGVAFLVTKLLEDAVSRGTGVMVRSAGYAGGAAGKTGTTNDAADVWFIGYTPELVAGIWIGFDQRKTVIPGATGGELAAPLWGRIMSRIAPRGRDGWDPPPGIEIRWVDTSGNVIDADCRPPGPTRPEYFLAGTAPEASCPRHLFPDPFGAPDTLAAPDSTAAGEDGGEEDPAPPPPLRQPAGGDPPPETPPEAEEERRVEPRKPPKLLGRPVPVLPPPPPTPPPDDGGFRRRGPRSRRRRPRHRPSCQC